MPNKASILEKSLTTNDLFEQSSRTFFKIILRFKPVISRYLYPTFYELKFQTELSHHELTTPYLQGIIICHVSPTSKRHSILVRANTYGVFLHYKHVELLNCHLISQIQLVLDIINPLGSFSSSTSAGL